MVGSISRYFISKFQSNATIYVVACSTNLRTHIVTCCIFIFASDKYLIPFSQFLTLRFLCRDNGFFQQSEAMSPWLSYFCRLSGHLRAQQNGLQSALQTSQKENTHRIPFFFYISPSQPLSKIHQS